MDDYPHDPIGALREAFHKGLSITLSHAQVRRLIEIHNEIVDEKNEVVRQNWQLSKTAAVTV